MTRAMQRVHAQRAPHLSPTASHCHALICAVASHPGSMQRCACFADAPCSTCQQVNIGSYAGSFTLDSCQFLCASNKLPLYGLNCATRCYCSAAIPDAAAQAGGCVPASNSPSCGDTIELHYTHSGTARLPGMPACLLLGTAVLANDARTQTPPAVDQQPVTSPVVTLLAVTAITSQCGRPSPIRRSTPHMQLGLGHQPA
jgi:hypothetical protein